MIVIKCFYQNDSRKDIRAFTGSIAFQDLFGREILRTGITVSNRLVAGETANWEGVIEYNQFKDSHQRLRNSALENMKVVWEPESVIFADGTQIGSVPRE